MPSDEQQIAADDDDERGPRQPVVDEEHDHGDVDHQPVGERVGVLPELRLDVVAAREPTVDLIGDSGDPRRRSPQASCGRRRRARAAPRTRARARSARSSARSAAGRAARRLRGRSLHKDSDGPSPGTETIPGESRCDRDLLPARLRRRPLACASSARCADGARAATSGRGARRCSPRPPARRRRRSAASTS